MQLSETDKIHYLANVLLVIRADGTTSPRETAALESIRKNLEAKRPHLAAATALVEAGGYQFRLPGTFADQVRNLEDLLFVTLTDGDLEAREAQLVGDYCHLAGIYQDQLDKLTADTVKRCDSGALEIACPACGFAGAGNSRFCPACGHALTGAETKPVSEGFAIPPDGYALEFCESTAGGFAAALNLAKATGRLLSGPRNKKMWHMVPYAKHEFTDMLPVAAELAGMRNRRISLDGVELNWQEVFGFIWCASRRNLAYRPIEYCFGRDENRVNPWGCKQVPFTWDDYAAWFSYGKWEKAGILRGGAAFVFDKARIRHELATALFPFRFCPHMRPQLIEAVLHNFPERAEVTKDGPWDYRQAFEELPGCIKVVERQGSGDASYTNEYFADGVRPRGHRLLKELLKKSFQDCGVSDVNPASLLA